MSSLYTLCFSLLTRVVLMIKLAPYGMSCKTAGTASPQVIIEHSGYSPQNLPGTLYCSILRGSDQRFHVRPDQESSFKIQYWEISKSPYPAMPNSDVWWCNSGAKKNEIFSGKHHHRAHPFALAAVLLQQQ